MQFRDLAARRVRASASTSSCSSSTSAWSSAPSPRKSRTSKSSTCRDVLKEVIMTKRGLVLVVGGTGSGKSTTLAAMIDHRNAHFGRPHHHGRRPGRVCAQRTSRLITHREVGVDTHSWHHALKNTLRQAPDVILIGEIRDTETMEHAIAFAETGHLCLGTLHANNANQTMDRIINFFPEERRNQLLMDLSANLRAIVSQRLVRTEDGKGRKAAIEILLNTPDHRGDDLQGRIPRDQGNHDTSRASSACAPSTRRCSSSTTRATSAMRKRSATPTRPMSFA